ncbi:hypothetical protein ACHAXA_010163 [Cyclostephanos tholiformis]|uniref:Uncharacterized protein n=1 Tax=Cyclostephanos tholiformis TaxID=382380 RepID=A0ABD3RBZ8_9STRA
MLSVTSSAVSRHLLPRHRRIASGPAVTRNNSGDVVDGVPSLATVAVARRNLATRRPQIKGRRRPPIAIPRLPSNKHQQTPSSSSSSSSSSSPSSATTTTTTTTAAQQQQQQQQHLFRTTDPHSIANEMVSLSSSKMRTPGTESVASLTREQRLSNYAMAGGLLAFVSYVFYYSLASVGGENKAKSLLFGMGGGDSSSSSSPEVGGGGDDDGGGGSDVATVVNPDFEDFLREANEGRTMEEERADKERRARGDARELVDMEESTAARLKSAGLGEEVVVGSSVNEEEEREMARIAGFDDGGGKVDAVVAARGRPIWKRVVFFWRRE